MTTSQRVIQWGFSHQRELGIAFAASLLLLLGIAGYGALTSARAQQANEELAAALADYRAQRFAEAAGQLTTVADAWGATGAGALARLYAGDAYLAAGNAEQAATELQKSLGNPAPAAYLVQQASLNLGVALEKKNDLVGAAEQYAAAATTDGPYRALALLREARVRAALSDSDRAEELYEKFIQDFPGQPEIPVIEAKLAAS